jgi:hypothetical protein
MFYEDNVPTPWLHYIELNAKRCSTGVANQGAHR